MNFVNDMAKNKEKKLARVYYVEQGKSAKEIAKILNVTEKTVGGWKDKGNWKTARDAFMFSGKERIKNIEDIISNCAEQRLSLQKKYRDAEQSKDLNLAQDLLKQMSGIADEAAKWNKTLDNLKTATKVSLENYVHVMEALFKDLHNEHPKIFLQLIDFQEKHLNKVINKY